ncbi:MAG: PilZ domain-containing protein [Spirochaetaceae bacterium]|nr:MAG: PilZ domain-containing protein [Spirochaetaceae bacterium]
MILLQTRYQFLASPDSRTIMIFLASAAGFIGIIILGGIISRRRNRHLDPVQRRKYGRYVFQRMARNIGLQRHHIEILEYLIRVCGVRQPFLIFSNSGLLDDILKKGIYALHQNTKLKEEERERRLTYIFQIKQIIERNARRGIGVRSTIMMRPGQSITITTETGRQYSTRVVSNLKDMVAIAAVNDDAGSQIRWPRGTRLKINFWRESDSGYAFESKVLGYDKVRGTLCVLLHHAKTLKKEQQRKYRRSPIHRPCFFFPVLVVESGTGRRAEKKAVVQTTRRFLGNLVDISAGGCSVNSLYPLKTGSLCKIEFELARRQRITVFGKVKRIRKTGLRSGIMHIMFTKLSSRFLNQIYLYVYDYTPPRYPVPAR